MRHIDATQTPLWSLVSGLNLLLSQDIDDDAVCCAVVAKRLRRALRADWLPPEARRSADDTYQRHLLYEDEAGRFSVGSFVWKPGQATPVHDHTGWGVVGVVDGELVSENFATDPEGRLAQTSVVALKPGATTWLFPAAGDIHRIVNPSTRNTAISIHVYGAPFAAVCRNRYGLETNMAPAAALPSAADGIRAAPARSLSRG